MVIKRHASGNGISDGTGRYPRICAALFKEKPKEMSSPVTIIDAVWREVFEQRLAGGPIDRGFDLYFGTDVPNWPPYCFIDNDRTVGIPSEFLASHLLGNNQASKQGPALQDWTLEPILPALGDRARSSLRVRPRDRNRFCSTCR